jgi:hypothetical protein
VSITKVIATEKDLAQRISIFRISEDELKRIDVQVIPHYGWVTCLTLHFSSGSPIQPYNNTRNLGYVLHHLFQLFDIREDGDYMSNIANKRVRLVYSYDGPYYGQCVAIGHPYKDKFIFFEDLMKVSETVYG